MNSDCYYTRISFLAIKNIYNIVLVSKRFYIISKNELILGSLYNNKFSDIECTKMFHDTYKKCHKLNKFLIVHKKDIAKINGMFHLLDNQFHSLLPEICQLEMLESLVRHYFFYWEYNVY